MKNILVIGVGGAGVDMGNVLVESNDFEFDTLATDSELARLEKSLADKLISLDSPKYPFIVSSDPSDEDRIKEAMKNYSSIIVIAGLGGSTGSKLSATIGKIAKKLEIKSYMFATLPFSMEGEERMDLALNALQEEIAGVMDKTLLVENESLMERYGKDTVLSEVFSAVALEISPIINRIVEGNPEVITEDELWYEFTDNIESRKQNKSKKKRRKLDTYLEFYDDGLAYIYESDIPFTGTATYYYKNGHKKEEISFIEGVREGVSREWRKPKVKTKSVTSLIGSLDWTSKYKNDELHGEATSYRKSGIKNYSTFYEDGELVGPSSWYNKKGQLKMQEIIEDGVTQKIVWFRGTGKIRSERAHNNGQPSDTVIFYDKKGKMDYEIHYKPGTDEQIKVMMIDSNSGERYELDEDIDEQSKLSEYFTKGIIVFAIMFLGIIGYELVLRLVENGVL